MACAIRCFLMSYLCGFHNRWEIFCLTLSLECGVEQKCAFVSFIPRLLSELEEHIPSSPLHESLFISTEGSSISDVMHTVERGKVYSLLLADHYKWVDSRVEQLTILS